MNKLNHAAIAFLNLLLLTGGFLTPPATAQAHQKPNVLFILMDNLGYSELGVYGGGVTRGHPRRASTNWPVRDSA